MARSRTLRHGAAAVLGAGERHDAAGVRRSRHTVLGRPINMFIIGYPAPKPTAAAVSDNPAALVNCNVHGNEPSSREACLILARELAFGTSPRLYDILSTTTILLV